MNPTYLALLISALIPQSGKKGIVYHITNIIGMLICAVFALIIIGAFIK